MKKNRRLLRDIHLLTITTNTMKGTVKTVLVDKNFGFITPEDGSKDIFFHASALNGVDFSQIKIGDTVNFEVEQSEKGPRATNVTVA